MQNYMISSRKENKITPSESITDRAAKDFRSIVKAKLEKADQKQNNRFLYAASTFLLIVILIIGVTMVNNYDKIKAVQTSIDQITKTVEKAENEKEAQAAEGKVTTQVEETTEEETGKTDTAGTTQTPMENITLCSEEIRSLPSAKSSTVTPPISMPLPA